MKTAKPLEHYQQKRDFKKTAEPGPVRKKIKSKNLMFVIQEHHASHLHYDFRLEMEGVLRSWAVPKGPTPRTDTKRLAMEVEDHPMEYGGFEGIIPEGEYGGGEVLIWDTGTYEPEGDPITAYQKGHIDFIMRGKRMKGRWTLIRTRGKGERAQWMLFKRSDEYANKEKGFRPLREYGAWKTRPKIKKKSKLPAFVEPELALLVDELPLESGWIHEMKFDGYRIQARIDGKKVKLLTRTSKDWTNKYAFLAKAFQKLKVKNAILDGELIALDENGHSHFQSLQLAMKEGNTDALVYYAFDLLYLNDVDLREEPLANRKELLQALLAQLPAKERGKTLRYSDHFEGDGGKFLKASCGQALEGVVSKRIDSPYRSGRGDDWVKSKCTKRQEFVIGGYTEGTGKRGDHFGALLLGVYENEKLRYVGRCGTGFNQDSLSDLLKRFKKLETDESPFAIKSPHERIVHFLKPELAAEVTFTMWTADKILRNPVFEGLREDKPMKEIVTEKETKTAKVLATVKKTSSKHPKLGSALSHPEKRLFAKEKISKQDVAEYYLAVAPSMLPHIKDRPLSLKRCPDGTNGECFYQKHFRAPSKQKAPSSPLKEVMIEEGNGIHPYVTIDSPEGLVALTQISAFELHAWNCRRESIEFPDQIVMDFDPDEGLSFEKVKKGVIELKRMLDRLKLKSFLKVTGGKGLHVHIPFEPLYDWDQIKEFSHTLADEMVSRFPKEYTSTMSKKERTGKIFIDYLRNGRGSTAVAPYSLRASEKSAVAMPIEWGELKKLKNPSAFTLSKALAHLKKRKTDPWKDYFKVKQKISILAPKRPGRKN